MKKYLLILFLCLMLILVGCAPRAKKTVESVGSPFISGDKGLIAEFLQMGIFNEGDNIEEIFHTESFPVEVALKNKGEADIDVDKAVIKLSGVELTQFTPSPGIPAEKKNTIKLERVSEFNKAGSEETISFGGPFTYTGSLVGNVIDLSFFAKVEYNYNTSVSVPKVCFKGDLNDPSLCKVEEPKQVFSSAGPVQIKSAAEKSAGTGKISVELEVQNVGSGKVTLQDPTTGTPTAFDHRFDQLSFTVVPADKWDCKAGGNPTVARLDSTGKATIVCRLKTALVKQDLFTQELGITLMYKYRDIIHKQLRIKRST